MNVDMQVQLAIFLTITVANHSGREVLTEKADEESLSLIRVY